MSRSIKIEHSMNEYPQGLILRFFARWETQTAPQSFPSAPTFLYLLTFERYLKVWEYQHRTQHGKILLASYP